jgi:adenylate cyclase class 2
MLEREVKLLFPSAGEARAAVERSGALPVRAGRLQQDTLFDTGDGALRRRGCALRVRVDAGVSTLTFKGPVQPGPMKVREELETVAGDGASLRRILAALGYEPWFRYEKHREEFAAPGVVIALDETPIGTFVELEGDESGIREVTSRLGRRAEEYILASYRTLFLERRALFGIEGNDMVFPATH